MDSRARKNLSNINTELQDVHRIMVQNIEDVLVRGESLSSKLSHSVTFSHYSNGFLIFRECKMFKESW